MPKKGEKYLLKLTSNITKVNLPKPLENYKNLKVNMVSFVTGSAGNRLMRVNITGFNDNTYFDGSAIVKYTKAYPMPNYISTLMVDSSDSDRNDVEVFIREENVGMSSLVIEVSIDDLYKDILPLNPLYIEFLIS